MSYDEWLNHIQYKLKKKYKIIDINYGKCGMRINFVTGFSYGIDYDELKDMWSQDLFRGIFNDLFDELCKSIDKEYLKWIKNF